MRSAFSSMTRSNVGIGRKTVRRAATLRPTSARKATAETAEIENRIRLLPSDNQQAGHGGVQRAGVWRATGSARHVPSRIALLQLATVPFATRARGRVRHDIAVDPDDGITDRHGQNRGTERHPADFDRVRMSWTGEKQNHQPNHVPVPSRALSAFACSRCVATAGRTSSRSFKALEPLRGAAFDRAYITRKVAYHQAVLDAIDKLSIPTTENAELKKRLEDVRPAVAPHLEHAKALKARLGTGT